MWQWGGVSIACSAAIWTDKDGKLNRSLSRKISTVLGRIPKDKNKQFAIIILGNFVQGATVFASSSFLRQCLPIPDFCKFHDQWFGLNAAAQDGVLFMREPLVLYRRHPNQVTRAKEIAPPPTKEELQNAKRARQKWLEDVQDNVSLSEGCLRIIQFAKKLNDPQKKCALRLCLYVFYLFKYCGARYFLFWSLGELKRTCASLFCRKQD